MPSFLDLLGNPSTRPLWLDANAYAGRLLAPGGAIPWLDAAAFVGWQRKAQGLLKSDVVTLNVEPVVTAWLSASPDLRASMAAKSQLLSPLKTLLATDALCAHLLELLRGLRASFASAPLALALPSPRRWITTSYAQSGQGEVDEITADDTDTAAMYAADFLRSFGETGLDVLLLEEDLASEPASADDLALVQPVLNVAAHYRWVCGLRFPETSTYTTKASGFAFAVAPAALKGTPTGVIVGETFWGGAKLPALSEGGFRFATIPEQAKPESVLERLKVLR